LTIVGGAGNVGSAATSILAKSNIFSEIIIADKDFERANEIAKKLGSIVSFKKLDADDPDSIRNAVIGSSVILNTIGPCYKFGSSILNIAINLGIDYIDICDDIDGTEALLKMDNKAKNSNVSAIINTGSSPGLTNIIAKFVSDSLLDKVNSVDIYHAHGGEPTEGPGVIKHRIHSMIIDIPIFDNGSFKMVNLFDESGKSQEEELECPGIGKTIFYPYPHPETITLPKYIKGIKHVANKGTVLPLEYMELIRNIARLKIVEEEPIDVLGQKIAPIDFAVGYILNNRKKILEKAKILKSLGCLKIVVKGEKNREKITYNVYTSTNEMGLPEGTGLPAALVTMLMGLGKIKTKGVNPPEGAINPMELFYFVKEKMPIGEEVIPLIVESVNENGEINKLNLSSIL